MKCIGNFYLVKATVVALMCMTLLKLAKSQKIEVKPNRRKLI